jgi:transcriptional regulator NrdR family protein
VTRRSFSIGVPKFTCPQCGESTWRTINSRFHEDVDAVVRHRKCRSCGFTLTTEETVRRSEENRATYNI